MLLGVMLSSLDFGHILDIWPDGGGRGVGRYLGKQIP